MEIENLFNKLEFSLNNWPKFTFTHFEIRHYCTNFCLDNVLSTVQLSRNLPFGSTFKAQNNPLI